MGIKNAASLAREYLRAHVWATPAEVAQATGCSARTARRVVRWERERRRVQDAHAAYRNAVGRPVEDGQNYGAADALAGVFGLRRAETKRILVLSDLHCGSLVGLTPPAWQTGDELQRDMWQWYQREMVDLGPVDACFVMGDCIDGKGKKSGGVEQITTDLIEQTDIATAALRHVQTENFVLVHGTDYHVSIDGEDMERLIARNLKARIGGHEWIDVNGCIFDLKHKVGASQLEHTRHTAIARERLANMLWADRQMAPRANVFLRGHVHYHVFSGGVNWLGMTLPAMQGPGGRYGVRDCSGLIHFGFVVFTVTPDGKYSHVFHEYVPSVAEPKAVCL